MAGRWGPIPEEWTPRVEVVGRIVARVHIHRLILVRGTPGSGKSILLRLIAKHMEVNHPEVDVKIILMWTQAPGAKKSEQVIQHHTSYTYDGLLNSPKTMVLIDEGQETYSDAILWSQFKIHGNSSAMFIIFSAYGSAGAYPASIPGTLAGLVPLQRISLSWEPKISNLDEVALEEMPVGLYLQPHEAADLIDRFRPTDKSRPNFENDACQYLTEMSGGHAGALGGLLEQIMNNKV